VFGWRPALPSDIEKLAGARRHLPEQSIACERYFGVGSDLPNVTTYALVATPAACAHSALSGVFGRKPIDLVVSGINQGANLGHGVLYSGTVGAALTGQLLGYPAAAASLDYSGLGVAD
jgi:5'-nucleotidase